MDGISWEYYKELYSQLEDMRSQNEGLLEENKRLREMYDRTVTANIKLTETVLELEEDLRQVEGNYNPYFKG